MTPSEAEKSLDDAEAVPLSEDRIREMVAYATDPANSMDNSQQAQLLAKVKRLERELAGRTVPGQCPWDLPFDSICPKHGGPLAYPPLNKANSGITFARASTAV